MQILYVTSNRIGDAVLSTGLLDHLVKTHPDARFTVACGPVAEGVFIRMPRLARLITMEKQPWGRHWLPLWAEAVRTRWDLVVDIRGSALAWLVRARRRAAMGSRRSGHKTAQIAAILGVDPPPLPVAWTAPEDRAEAARLLPDGPPVIALGPTANSDAKIWPAARFADLARRLATDLLPGARIAVFAGAGPREASIAAPVLAALPEAIDFAGRLTLPVASAALARCTLFVGNDSGLMHLAAAAGCATLGLFGPTPAEEYAPAGRRTATAIAASGEMADLTVDAALAAARELLAS